MNKLIISLKSISWKNYFNPRFIGLVPNPFYFSRGALYRNIRSNSKLMKGVMLDFGCGSKPYKELFIVDKYVGLDFDGDGHDHKNEDIDFFYDGQKFPFENGSFDSFFSSQVFEHVANLENILKKFLRVLKPGANLLITVPFVWDEHEIPFDFKRYTSFGIKQTLNEAGFKILDLKKTSNYVNTIFQLWNAYIFQYVFPKNQYIKFILTPVFIFPVTLLGIILSKLLPVNDRLYLDNVIIAQKPN